MFGIIAEDPSDVEALKVIVRRLKDDTSLPILAKGYSGCSEMLRKGSSQFRLFAKRGVEKYIICYDSDRADPEQRRQEAKTKIWDDANIHGDCCVVVPVQELEAWILADIGAVSNIIKSWSPSSTSIPNPETIPDPKEHLEKLSRINHRPRYSHAIHNSRVAQYLDLNLVAKKCPSFSILKDFIIPPKDKTESIA